MKKTLSLMAVLMASAMVAPAAQAAGNIECNLRYDMAGWSLFYKTASGNGTITCDNGTRMLVKIKVKGGGLTVGKSKIVGGTGRFSGAYSPNDLFGTYAAVGAHAGAVRSSGAAAMTKGDISLALAGTGKGWDLGIDGTAFTIERR
ncbi:hypothetical protein [Stenotrophomonas tumulicola]|uniref:Secreted protein n=1 Tax=Stenotrophomonas tumulicola TaxID=1685415 RepID=A0A7W3II03_9GAMM|nr:hypothetical protein [Stenotrophomonas tumulicola]MBA8682565.1 hypothetical protein [Stenotrophomonas tumulicola]